VLWCNVRDAFGTEISQMYRTLRSNGVLSYDVVQQRFTSHQAKWPEAVFNEDAWVKYIGPLISPAAGKTPTASYLPMAQGSKAEQRKWWLYNRFRYMDSKWTAGDARNNIIELRGYAKANITVTPYSDIYPAVRYASYTVTERGTHGVPTTLVCPIDTLNDSEIWIFSAPQLASVGDLSPLKVGRADFRAAVNLQDIRVGSNATGYTNPNLTQLYVGNNSLLRTIDARNCTALSGALDFSGASNVEYVYLDGTAVTSVSLPSGGIMKTLSLPDTITNLTVLSQPGITSFSMEGNDYSSITTLRVENSGSAIPVLDILDQMPENSRVRILGFTALAESTDDVEDFFDYLDTMRGLDESGNNLPAPVVQGTITGLGTITGSWLAQMNARYPDVTITYQHISSVLSYYSWDGETLLHTENVADGGNGTWGGTPTRTSTAQYSYSFVGWSPYTDQSVADPTATQNVGADRSVYAAYTATTRTYTVTWKNADNTTLETDQNVPYGTTPTYNGTTPTYQGETSTGWNPAVGPITGDTTYTAIYIPTYQVRFYSGTSSSSSGTLLQTTRVQEGSAAVYSGTTPTNPSGESYWEFTGWDKALTNIRAATDFYAQYRDTRSPVIQYVEGTMTDYVSDTATTVAGSIFRFHTALTTATTSATSIGSYAFDNTTALTTVDLTSTSATTIGEGAFNGCAKLESLVIRSATMSTLSSTLALNGTSIANGNGAIFVPDAIVDTYKADSKWGKFLILPLSEYPTTDYSSIRDSWTNIIAATNNGTANKYSIGDTKLLDVGSEGKVYAQVAKVDKTGLTFVTRGLLATSHRMNATATTAGGWSDSEMRTYLNIDIFALLPPELQSSIAAVTKYSDGYENGAIVHDGVVTTDKLWLLSAHEVFGGTTYETQGEHYSGLFSNNTDRVRRNQSGSAVGWGLRSAYSATQFCSVGSFGSTDYSSASGKTNVVFGFTIGHHPTEEEKWTALKTSITNGTLKTDYSIGDTLPLDLGTEGKVDMQIVAFDEDGSHVSFVAKQMLATHHRMNPADNNGTQGTGANGGWEHSEMRTYLEDTILPLVPSYVSSAIVPVTKYSDYIVPGETGITHDQTTTDKLWIPSAREVFGGTSYEQTGTVYTGVFKDAASRIKYDQSGSANYWWLRSAYSQGSFRRVNSNSIAEYYYASQAIGVVPGFCL